MPGQRMSSETTSNNEERYLVLVEFIFKHMGFQLAELQSILEMHGIRFGGPDCRIVALPNASTSQISVDSYEHTRPFVILSFPSKNAGQLSRNEFVNKWDVTRRKKRTISRVCSLLLFLVHVKSLAMHEICTRLSN